MPSAWILRRLEEPTDLTTESSLSRLARRGAEGQIVTQDFYITHPSTESNTIRSRQKSCVASCLDPASARRAYRSAFGILFYPQVSGRLSHAKIKRNAQRPRLRPHWVDDILCLCPIFTFISSTTCHMGVAYIDEPMALPANKVDIQAC